MTTGLPLVDEQLELRLEPLEGSASNEPVHLQKTGVIVFGRSSSAHFRLPKDDKRHSRLHFAIEFSPPLCRLLDLGSRNGTLVNGQRVLSCELYQGDVITAGGTSFRVQLSGGSFASSDSQAGDEDALAFNASPPVAEDEGSDDSMAFYALDAEREKKLAQRKQKLSGEKKAASEKKPSVVAESNGHESARKARKEKAAEQLKRLAKQPHSPDFDIDQLLAAESSAEHPKEFEAEEAAAWGLEVAIPGYELVRSLGRGSIGEVFLATDEATGDQVAVKVMQTLKASDRDAVDAFLAEMNPLLELDHPNIVKYRAFGATRNCVYAVSDYIEGIDAERVIKHDGAMGPVRVAKLGGQILLGLDYAHGLGHVHRDIKPSNLLITEGTNRELCLLADFGLARTYQNSPLFGVKMKTDLERSMRFMAPEQFMNFKEMPMAVDIYSSAATFYYLLTSKFVHDFESLSFDQCVNKLKRDDATPIIRHRLDVPPEMATLLQRCLSRFPQKRVGVAGQFRKELYRFIK